MASKPTSAEQQRRAQQRTRAVRADDPAVEAAAYDAVSTHQMETFVEQGLAVNLDEATPDPVSVTVREWVEVQVPQPDGTSRTRRQWTTRQALIETYVPMRVFNRMLASRRVALAARAAYQAREAAGTVEEETDPLLLWMQQQVHAVWVLTEPDMTLQALQDGLTLQQVQGLFTRFFHALLPHSTSAATTAASGSSA